MDVEFRDRCVELLAESDARLVFQAALSMGAFPLNDAAIEGLANAVARNPQDRWLRPAAASSIGERMPELFSRIWKRWLSTARSPEIVASDVGAQVTLVEQYAELCGALASSEFFAEQLVNDTASPPEGDMEVLTRQRLAFALLRGAVRGLRRGSRHQDLLSHAAIRPVVADAQGIALDSDRAAAIRVEAVHLLGAATAEEALPSLAALVGDNIEPSIMLAAIEALGNYGGTQPAERLLCDFRRRTPRTKSAVLATFTTPERYRVLLSEIEAERISARDIDPALVQRLARLTDPELKSKAEQLFSFTDNTDRQAIVTNYRDALTMPHDLARGRAIFEKNCATCHRVGGVGVNVGADISDTRTQTPEQLLLNILDPNRAVDGNYFGYLLVDAAGRTYTGIVTAETATSVTLRQPEARDVSILRQDIEEFSSTGLSLMPVGLEKSIDLQQMADLIGFLKNWRYVDGPPALEASGEQGR
ncbi:MAG: c-type cytochrome [Planctomycetaceae bacterium]|nr:c-type cytochrome [Planctomycetaceae bacterium]